MSSCQVCLGSRAGDRPVSSSQDNRTVIGGNDQQSSWCSRNRVSHTCQRPAFQRWELVMIFSDSAYGSKFQC